MKDEGKMKDKLTDGRTDWRTYRRTDGHLWKFLLTKKEYQICISPDLFAVSSKFCLFELRYPLVQHRTLQSCHNMTETEGILSCSYRSKSLSQSLKIMLLIHRQHAFMDSIKNLFQSIKFQNEYMCSIEQVSTIKILPI